MRTLGHDGPKRTGDVLVRSTAATRTSTIKKAVINGLFIQDNATALVGLARKEQDLTMKKEIVSRLSNMHSKVATDYMIELLGK